MASSGLASRGERKKRPHKYLCGVPNNECVGGTTSKNQGMKNVAKSHSSPQEASKCYGRYLIKQGYKQVGPREYCKDDGPVVVLTKRCRFGAKLRGGKGGRFMGCEESKSGTIVSC